MIFTSLLFLGAKKTAIAVVIYIMLGAVGLPVFSGFSGGFGVLFGPTSGFIWGFLLFIPVFCVFLKLCKNKIFALTVYTFCCYILGSAVYSFFALGGITAENLLFSLSVCAVPFIVPDIIKILLAASLSKKLQKIFYLI